MKTLVDVLLFLAWVSAYLGILYWVGRCRRARAVGPLGRGEYRADWDVGLRLAMVLLSGFLGLCVYLATRMLNRLL